jgi:SHS family lactate transporter-like MFS transporter
VPTTSHGWRSLFWFGAAPPVLIIAFRYSLPETNAYQVMAAEREARFIAGTSNIKNAGLRSWLGTVWADIKRNWVLFIFMIVLMTGFNSCSHGSQDLYPTFLKNRTPHQPIHDREIPLTLCYRSRTGANRRHGHICSRPDRRTHWRYITRIY